MNIPIKPMFRLNLNQCPKCHGTLVLIEKTLSVIDVNEAGIPTNTSLTDDEVEVSYLCSKCGLVYEVEKEGMHYIIKRSTKKIVRENKIKKQMDGFNPFYS